jgi:hypothetical protein
MFDGAEPAQRTLARACCPDGNSRSRRARLGLRNRLGGSSQVFSKLSALLAGSSLHTNISPRPLGLNMGWWRPAARSRLVTCRSPWGGPYAGTARHTQSRRHGAGPAARARSTRHAGVARPRNARLRDLSAIALCYTSGHLRLSRSPLPCRRDRGGGARWRRLEIFIPQSPGCRQGTSLVPVTAWHLLPGSAAVSALGHFGSTTQPQGRGGKSPSRRE